MVAGHNGDRDDRGRATVPEREPSPRALPHRDQREARHQGQGEAQHRIPGLPRPVPRGRRREACYRSRPTQSKSTTMF